MAYRISRRSDLLTKVVKKDVLDALLKTLQGLEPIDGITTRNVNAGDSADGGEDSSASVTLTGSRPGDSEVPRFDRKVMV